MHFIMFYFGHMMILGTNPMLWVHVQATTKDVKKVSSTGDDYIQQQNGTPDVHKMWDWCTTAAKGLMSTSCSVSKGLN